LSGVVIIGGLMLADPAIRAIVAEDSIKAGLIPRGGQLPALVPSRISRVKQFETLDGVARERWRERVQVTAAGADYEAPHTLVDLVTEACRDKRGTLSGFERVSITHAGIGPDFMDDEANIYLGSVDFFVSYLAAR
jgi:hypothetical protein